MHISSWLCQKHSWQPQRRSRLHLTEFVMGTLMNLKTNDHQAAAGDNPGSCYFYRCTVLNPSDSHAGSICAIPLEPSPIASSSLSVWLKLRWDDHITNWESRAEFREPSNLWRHDDIRLSIKLGVCSVTVRSVRFTVAWPGPSVLRMPG